jgi:5-methyltetrahydropteroyltriglutamate--homocysteine methyltransferase
MVIPTEPIGSIPRPAELLAAVADHAAGRTGADELEARYDEAVRDTVARLVALGSPVVTDGEQRKPSFATYPLAGLTNLAPDGVVIPFADGHTRQLPRLTKGPFRYAVRSVEYLRAAQRHATVPVKQAVIALARTRRCRSPGTAGSAWKARPRQTSARRSTPARTLYSSTSPRGGCR